MFFFLSSNLIFFLNSKEINFKEFENLLKELAPKYKKDKKLADDAAAVADMKKKLMPGIKMTGTTVCTNYAMLEMVVYFGRMISLKNDMYLIFWGTLGVICRFIYLITL